MLWQIVSTLSVPQPLTWLTIGPHLTVEKSEPERQKARKNKIILVERQSVITTKPNQTKAKEPGPETPYCPYCSYRPDCPRFSCVILI